MGNPGSIKGGRGRDSGRGTGRGGTEEPLHAAARAGDLHAIQSICCSDPLAVNTRDKHSRSPLHLAAWAGHADVVSYLCQNKADARAAAIDDMGAIHFAAQKGHLEVIRVLLSAGVSIKATNRKGFTPLHYASQGSHLELVKYLVRKGSSTLTTKNKAGKTPRDLAESDEVRLYLKECEVALKNGEKLPGEKVDQHPVNKEKEDGDAPKEEDNRNADGEAVAVAVSRSTGGEEVEEGQGREKRKDGEETGKEGTTPQPKRAKVSIGHLMAENDMDEEDD